MSTKQKTKLKVKVNLKSQQILENDESKQLLEEVAVKEKEEEVFLELKEEVILEVKEEVKEEVILELKEEVILEVKEEPIEMKEEVILELKEESILENLLEPKQVLEKSDPKEKKEEFILETIPITQFILETTISELEKNDIPNKTEELLNYIKSIIGENGIITSLNIIEILNKLIHNVEQYNILSGSQKKMLILDTLKKVIDEQYGDNPEKLIEKQLLIMLINNTMPQYIDILISAINGKIKFIKTKEKRLFTVLKNLFTSIKQKFSCKTKNKK